MEILFINNKKVQCGVYQYGKRVYQILSQDKIQKYKYEECDTEMDYNRIFTNNPTIKYSVVIYNYHPSTLYWINKYTMKGIKNIGIIHDGNSIPGFSTVIDTGYTEKTGDTEGIPRPLYELDKWSPDNKKISNMVDQEAEYFINAYQNTGIPIFGSFGFGFDNKGFDKVIKLVNEQYDEAVIKLVIPVAFYSEGEALVKRVRDMCENKSKKPNIHLMITHRFFSNTDILRFLASNTMNLFLYDYMIGRGLSSVIDYALSVNVPIGISNSYMFRHIYDDSICVYINQESSINPINGKHINPRTIKECMANSLEYCQKYKEKYSNKCLINKFNYLINNRNTVSQANQDTFVLEMTNEKRNGTYLQIGTNSGIVSNNTYLLEYHYDWWGLLVNYNDTFVEEYKTYRPNSKYIINDATKIDYHDVLEKHNMPHNIDYLQIDLDVDNRSTLNVLELLDATVMDTYKFATITFEHDIYRGNYYNTREESRSIFTRRGYILVFPDVTLFYNGNYCVFEDWWVHPELVSADIINAVKQNVSMKHNDIALLLHSRRNGA